MFSTKYKVTIGDINYGGHMGNEKALTLFQQGRIDWFESLGLSERNIGSNTGVIQIESHVKYLGEVFLNDELTIKISDITFDRKSITLHHEIIKNDKVVISGSVVLLSYNYEKKKVVRLPEELTKHLK